MIVEFDVGKGQSFQTLDRTDLEVPGGQFVALVGASGCGKTTLPNHMVGLHRPTRGAMGVDGRPAVCPNPDVGYMLARDALLPWRSAQRNVELCLEARKGHTRARRGERTREMLDLVGLSKFTRNNRPQLSQGMLQRAAITRTLAPDPGILLMEMDESGARVGYGWPPSTGMMDPVV